MGTRSIIAIPTDDSWKGRYVHWDGYPANMGKELTAIIQRDGYETAVKVLTEDHKSWSSISSRQPSADPLGGITVPGYGVAHMDVPEDQDPWLFPGDEDWTEWVYLLLPFGIAVYERSNSDEGDLFRGLFDWAENHDWDAIQSNIYSDRQEA